MQQPDDISDLQVQFHKVKDTYDSRRRNSNEIVRHPVDIREIDHWRSEYENLATSYEQKQIELDETVNELKSDLQIALDRTPNCPPCVLDVWQKEKQVIDLLFCCTVLCCNMYHNLIFIDTHVDDVGITACQCC